jgi:hypothetical protein
MRFAIAMFACSLAGLVAATASAQAASSWLLNNGNAGNGTEVSLGFGELGDVPLAGDWNGDGTDTPGIFRQRTAAPPIWILSNSTTGGGPLISFAWGSPGDIPVAGDWNGDGADTVGLFRQTATAPDWYLATANAAGGGSDPAPFAWGSPGDVPVVGDWNGDGVDTVGLFRQADWFLATANGVGGGSNPAPISFGNPGDTPLSGDWDGTNTDRVAIFRIEGGIGQFAVATANTSSGGAGVRQYPFGLSGDAPVAGDWDGDGVDTAGVMRGSVEFVAPPPAPPQPTPGAPAPQPNGLNASRGAKLTAVFTGRRPTARRIGFATRPTVTGRLVDEHGAGIGGAAVAVRASRRQFHAVANLIDTFTTAADGSFSYRVPSGPSRTITFTYTAFAGDPAPAATSAALRTLVRASLTAHATPRAPRARQLMRVTGGLRYLPRANVLVVIQARNGKTWQTAATVKTRAGGRYTWSHRFRRSQRGRTFTFRVHVDSPVYPFTPGNSPRVSVRVR